MSLPTSAQLITMDFAFQGQPFVTFAKGSISTSTLDYALQGQPFLAAASVILGGGPGGSQSQTYIINT